MVNPNYAEIIVVRHGETEWNLDGRIQVLPFFSNINSQRVICGMLMLLKFAYISIEIMSLITFTVKFNIERIDMEVHFLLIVQYV